MSFLSPDAAVETNVYMFPKGYKHVRETQEIGTDLRGPCLHQVGIVFSIVNHWRCQTRFPPKA